MIDNRGTGESDKPEEAWTMSDMVQDIEAVLRQEAIESFHLLGCSLGSMVVRHFVKQSGGEQLRSLSLLCAPNGIPATEEDQRTALFWDPSVPLIDSARKSWPIVHPDQWAKENDAMLAARFAEDMKNPTPARTFQFQLQAAMAAGDANPAVERLRRGQSSLCMVMPGPSRYPGERDGASFRHPTFETRDAAGREPQLLVPCPTGSASCDRPGVSARCRRKSRKGDQIDDWTIHLWRSGPP